MNREQKIFGVRALYPRLNQPYHFDAGAQVHAMLLRYARGEV